jgi:hypothetical protein
VLLVPVVSTDIAAAGYDPQTGELQVQFTTGAIYSYTGVPPEVYEGFLTASSKGAYFAQVFRKQPGLFPVQRIL